jgi:hypothetical protein
MAFNRTAWTALVDDDGSNLVGTVWNKARIAGVGAPIIQTTTSTGTVNDFALTADCWLLRCNNAAALTITGLAGGTDGQVLFIESVGGGPVFLAHQAAGSSVANRLFNIAGSAPTPLAPSTGRAQYVYDAAGGAWVLQNHEQGAWITPTYAAGSFTSNVGSWTVDAGDVTTFAYRLSGRTMTLSWYLQTTSVSGTPTQLRMAIPGPFTAAKAGLFPIVHDDAGGGNAGSFALVTGPGSTTVDNYKAYGGGSFANATNTTRVFGTITFEVN